MFLNSGDVIINPNAILQFAENSEQPDLLLHPIHYDSYQNGIVLVSVKSPKKWPWAIGMPAPHPGIIARKNLFPSKETFDLGLKLAMDFDWFYREVIKKSGLQIKIMHEPIVLMDGSGISSIEPMRGLLENKIILKRYRANYLTQIKLNLAIVFHKIKKR
jgi:hypothetical protein